MLNQIYLNLLISLIIAISISYYYYRKINYKFLLTFTIVFILFFTILYYLGPSKSIESFHNQEECSEKKEKMSVKTYKFKNFQSRNVLVDYDLYDYYLTIVDDDMNINAVLSKINPNDNNPYEKESNERCPRGISIMEMKKYDGNHNVKYLYLSNLICSRGVNDNEIIDEENSKLGVKVFNNMEPINSDLSGVYDTKMPGVWIDLNSSPSNDDLKNNIIFIEWVGNTSNYDILELIENFKYESEVLELLEDPVASENFNNTIENVQEEIMSNIQEELINPAEENYARVDNEMSEELNQEQEDILNQQEEYIRNVIDEEMIEEEDNNDIDKKKVAAKKLLSDSSNILSKTITGNNNQINPGIGVGISPVNIYINGTEVDVDKFKNHKGKKSEKREKIREKIEDNYYKKPSRIYNNCDWAYDKDEWCDGTYNYDKNKCGSNNNLLPCETPKVNKIPQTLNNLINTKKNNNKSEPCPLDVNKPWSIYKTGDDKESNNIIPEGFNL